MKPVLHADALRAKRGNLKQSETLVTTHTGKQYREARVDGKVVSVEVNESVRGFVVDTKPDKELFAVKDVAGLFIGSQDAAANLQGLMDNKITHILNVATGIVNAYEKDFKYKNVELLDVDETNILKALPVCFDFISEALYGGGAVLVHCPFSKAYTNFVFLVKNSNAGVSRSAAVVIAYVMENFSSPSSSTTGLSYEAAHELVKSSRPAIQPNRGFVKQLQKFDTDRGLLYE